jgi:hypothetical protein
MSQVRSGFSHPQKFCQFLGGLPPGMAQYRVLAPQRRQTNSTVNTPNPKNMQEKLINKEIVVPVRVWLKVRRLKENN